MCVCGMNVCVCLCVHVCVCVFETIVSVRYYLFCILHVVLDVSNSF